MSKNVIELSGNNLRYAREYTKTISDSRAEIQKIDAEIAELTAQLRARKVEHAAALAKAEAALLELVELGDEQGTFHLEAVNTKVSITATYVAEEPANATAHLYGLLGAGDRMVDTVMVPKREFSRTGYNNALKVAPEVEGWFNENITTKLAKPKIEIGG